MFSELPPPMGNGPFSLRDFLSPPTSSGSWGGVQVSGKALERLPQMRPCSSPILLGRDSLVILRKTCIPQMFGRFVPREVGCWE